MTKYFVKLKYWTVAEMLSEYDEIEQGADSKEEALEEFFLSNGEYPNDEIDLVKISIMEGGVDFNEDGKH